MTAVGIARGVNRHGLSGIYTDMRPAPSPHPIASISPNRCATPQVPRLAWLVALVLAAPVACDEGGDDAQDFRLAVDADDNDAKGGKNTDPDPLLLPIDHGQACENTSTLFMRIGNLVCTGVLVAPDVMLTAGHCVRDGANMRPLSSMSVGTGDAVCTDGSVNVARVFVHSGFQDDRGNAPDQGAASSGDLALVQLSGPVPNASVASLGHAIPGTASGDVTLTGFSGGMQRCGDATVIDARASGVLEIEGTLGPNGRVTACVGDSGGPVYQRGTNLVVGINSRVQSVVQPLPRGTIGGGGATECSGNLFAAVDWDWCSRRSQPPPAARTTRAPPTTVTPVSVRATRATRSCCAGA